MPVTSTRHVNGVFKGGGAKGAAYAGALKALEERGLWFGSVAGASAGAITASLIAAGMKSDALEAAVPEGLAAARSPIAVRLGKALLGHATSIFESRKLRTWLDTTLATQIGRSPDRGPVTFAELHEHTGIELYIVAMDLSNGLPVLFCRRTTPDVEVAGAVTSSSAIPAAFPPGRAVFTSGEDGTVVHQLVDGGTWANYPAFVFQDKSFRAWLLGESQNREPWSEGDHGGWNEESERPTVGFILGDPEPLEHRQPIGLVPMAGPDVNRRFDQGPTYTSPKRGPYLFGAVLSSDWARLIIGIALAAWVSLSIVTLPIGLRRFSTWLDLWMPDWLYPVALVGTVSVLMLAVMVAIGLVGVLIMVGRLIADTLVPSFNALMGVPTEVAPWIGLGEESVVLRVPHEGLSTTDFDIDEATQRAAVEAAYESVAAQLDDQTTHTRLEALFGDGEPVSSPYRPGERVPAVPQVPDKASAPAMAALVVATTLIGGLAWWATNSAGSEGIGRILVAVAVGVVVGGAAIWYVGGRTGARAAARARYGVGVTDRRPSVLALPAFGAGVALVVGGLVLSGVAMNDRADDTLDARVVSAADGPSADAGNVYLMDLDDDAGPISVVSDRHLRLGEKAFVRIDAETGDATLVGPLDDWLFPAAVILWVFGLGLITSGVRRYRWETRCQRLVSLAAGWEGERR